MLATELDFKMTTLMTIKMSKYHTPKPILLSSILVMAMVEDHIIQGCKRGDRQAQNELYIRYAPLMLSICRRYLRQLDIAEDVMIHGFYKVLSKVDSFNQKGSFEGWMKRIMVNECLMEIRKSKSQHLTVELDSDIHHPKVDFVDHLVYEELIDLLDELPTGYRTVFNLYVIEGYKHREIAEMLGVSVNTSKSQLILARKKLQLLIKKKSELRNSA